MECKHKPQDSRFIISTEYGRYYTFDRVQRCRKCGKRIKMKHKRAYIFTIIFANFSAILWYALFFCFDGMPILQVAVLAIYVGISIWASLYSGYFMTWSEVKLTDQEKAAISERNKRI